MKLLHFVRHFLVHFLCCNAAFKIKKNIYFIPKNFAAKWKISEMGLAFTATDTVEIITITSGSLIFNKYKITLGQNLKGLVILYKHYMFIPFPSFLLYVIHFL